ncbi:MAG: class I SAM-dependent methyltransferase [Trichloromonadaceae bacterium]
MENPPVNWNQKWRERAAEDLIPDPWLERALPLLPAGRALDLACGRGRNALHLAEHGFAVTAVDGSAEGLALLGEEARRRGLALTLRQQDLEAAPQLPVAAFEVVIDFFYLQRSLFPALKAALVPGGVVVMRTFSFAGGFAGGPRRQEFILHPGELLEQFAGWEILLHEEGLESSRKGGGLVGIVARKPLPGGGEEAGSCV